MDDDSTNEIATLDSKLVYQNRWMKVREDSIRYRDGSTSIYGVVEKADFVVIVPVGEDGSIHMVEQYRYPVAGRYWELPQGSWEQAPEADALEVARGELRQETGLIARRMTYVGHLFQGYGYATQDYCIFLAEDLQQSTAELDHEEQGLIAQCFPSAAVARMIREGEIKDASTVAALGLLQMKGLLQL
jgi:ADP-ribose pyrophosphatase